MLRAGGETATLHQRIANSERRKATEVPIVGPKFTDTVRAAERGDPGIMDLWTGNARRRQTVPEHGPVCVVLRQSDECMG
jgi:hypothetical protein